MLNAKCDITEPGHRGTDETQQNARLLPANGLYSCPGTLRYERYMGGCDEIRSQLHQIEAEKIPPPTNSGVG